MHGQSLEDLISREWRWQDFGTQVMLVTSGGAKVVLAPNPPPHGKIMIRDDNGRLVRIATGDEPLAKLLTAVPAMIRALRAIHANEGIDDDGSAGEALRQAGLTVEIPLS